MKIAILGCSGSGKTTLAHSLNQQLGYSIIELDSYFHLENWNSAEDQHFKSTIAFQLEKASKESGGWIADGNYISKLDDLVIGQADVVIWFNLPRSIVMYQMITRSLWRAMSKQELWNGNRERISNLFSKSPEENILVWTWTQHANYETKISALEAKAPTDQRWFEVKRRSDIPGIKNYLAGVDF